MKSRHLVDPALSDFADAPPLEYTVETLPAFRAMAPEAGAAAYGDPDPSVTTTEYVVPGPPGAPDVRLYVYTPPGAKTLRPAVFHIHGGGLILGDAPMVAGLNHKRARDYDCVVVSVEYRLAPETPYPGPVEDCYAGLKWTVEHAADIGIDPTRLVVAGESGGGGLAAALCLLAREKGGPPIALQFLIYPMLDHRTGTPDDVYNNLYAGEFGWSRSNNSFAWRSMLGDIDPAGDVPGVCSPARAASLAGLPPTFIGVGALDLFVDENIDYAARLGRDGVAIELHVYPGANHGFDLVPTAAVATQFKQDCARALRKALHP